MATAMKNDISTQNPAEIAETTQLSSRHEDAKVTKTHKEGFNHAGAGARREEIRRTASRRPPNAERASLCPCSGLILCVLGVLGVLCGSDPCCQKWQCDH